MRDRNEATDSTDVADGTDVADSIDVPGGVDAAGGIELADGVDASKRRRLPRGLVQVYTGDGKGKTTAALGQCMRAVGSGLKAVMLQFIKAGNVTSELRSAERLAPCLEIRQLGRSLSLIKGPPSAADIASARSAWAEAERVISSGGYDVVVLDEINVVLSLRMVSSEEVVSCLRRRPCHVEVILTGRGAPKEIIDAADLVTEMQCVKHPYDRGIAARKGIEY